jgi:hypothetical protein
MEKFKHGKKDAHGDVHEGTAIILEHPQPISVKEFADYLMKRINTIEKLLLKIPNTPKTKWGKDLIKDLMEEKYAVNASEGAYTDREMIEGGIEEILAIYSRKTWGKDLPRKIALVEKNEKGYFFTNEGMNLIISVACNGGDSSQFYINEIEF